MARRKKRGAPTRDRGPEGFFLRAINGSGKKTRVSSTKRKRFFFFFFRERPNFSNLDVRFIEDR